MLIGNGLEVNIFECGGDGLAMLREVNNKAKLSQVELELGLSFAIIPFYIFSLFKL